MLKRVWYRALTAVKSSSDFLGLDSYMQVCSPVICKNCRSCQDEGNSKHACDTSQVGIVNQHLANVLPISVRESIGETTGLTPPSLSNSAKLKHILNSYSVSQPSIVPMNTPSAIKLALNCLKVCSNSLTQCSCMLLTMRSNQFSPNFSNHFSSSQTAGSIRSGKLAALRSQKPDSIFELIYE